MRTIGESTLARKLRAGLRPLHPMRRSCESIRAPRQASDDRRCDCKPLRSDGAGIPEAVQSALVRDFRHREAELHHDVQRFAAGRQNGAAAPIEKGYIKSKKYILAFYIVLDLLNS